MDKITLEVTEGVYATAKAARAAGRVPMAYYGKNIKNRSFSIEYQEFRRAFKKGGRSTIMYLHNEKDEEYPILVHEIQYDPVTDDMVHIDLIAVDLNKPIRTKIPLILVGTPPAVKDLGGILVQNRNAIEVECLPKDLVHEIEVDVTSIADFHTSITIGQVNVPPGVKVLDAKNINVATVAAPHALIEEEEAAAAAAAAAAAPVAAPVEGAPVEGVEEVKVETPKKEKKKEK